MSSSELKLAVIGGGAMARSLIGSLARNAKGVQVGALLLPENASGEVPAGLTRFLATEDLIAARPSLVVECASHDAVREAVPKILEAGINVVVVSIGALSRRDTLDRLELAAKKGGSRMVVASGAVGGLDVLRAAKLAGLEEVTYSGRKPPMAWKDTPAEQLLDLDNIRKATIFFEGNAAEAASQYPKNANVTAAVALAGVGFESTRVKLFADPSTLENMHELEAVGAFGRFSIQLANKPLPDNPKTSWLAALSVEQAVIRHFQHIEC